jgi:hypothetical protein
VRAWCGSVRSSEKSALASPMTAPTVRASVLGESSHGTLGAASVLDAGSSEKSAPTILVLIEPGARAAQRAGRPAGGCAGRRGAAGRGARAGPAGGVRGARRGAAAALGGAQPHRRAALRRPAARALHGGAAAAAAGSIRAFALTEPLRHNHAYARVSSFNARTRKHYRRNQQLPPHVSFAYSPYPSVCVSLSSCEAGVSTFEAHAC